MEDEHDPVAEGDDLVPRPVLPVRVHTDWLVVVARRGAALPSFADLVHPSTERRAAGGAARPALVWRDDTGCLAVLAWPPSGAGGRTGWSVGPEGVVLVRGQVRVRGRAWAEPDTWVRHVDAAPRRAPGRHPLEDLVGDGTALVVGGDGRGVVGADLLGVAAVFHAQGRGWDAFASRPSLASAAVEPDRRPRRSADAAAWMALTGFVHGDATGHAGVRRLPVGARVDIAAPRRARVVHEGWPWLDRSGLPPDEEGLLDVVEASIVDQLDAATRLGPEPAVLDLTGGKDSRLVLAVAAGRLGLDRFRLRTVGAPDAPEVVIAGALARHLGVTHETGIPLRPRPIAFAEKADRFTDRTDGLITAWQAKLPHDDGTGEVRLSGLLGEALRADSREAAWRELVARSGPDAPAPDDWVASRFRGGPGLVRAEVAAALVAEVRHRLAEEDGAADALGSYYLRHIGCRVASPLVELEDDHRVLVFGDIVAARAAYALGADRRTAEVVHRRLIERARPDLLGLPLFHSHWARDRAPVPASSPAPAPAAPGPGRRAGLRRRLGRLQRRAAPSPGPPAVASPPARRDGPAPFRASTVAAMGARPDDERRAFVEDSVGDAANPIWAVVDRTRALDLLTRFDELSLPDRQALYGVASGARWLAGG